RSNDTHTIKLDGGVIDSLFLQQNEYFFDWDSIAANTVAGQNFPYESDFVIDFTNPNDPISIVFNVTNELISQSGATDGYNLAKTISDFLKEGNDTFDFKRFHELVGLSPGEDIAQFIMENTFGQCSDYNAAFVTMARLAGLPARYVTGYSGGEWNGNGYTVSTQHRSTWGEVRLELTGGASNIDLGWIPFDSCPDAENLEIVNQTLSPLTWDRNMSQNFTLDGQFRFTENTSTIENAELKAYLIPVEEVGSVPGSAVIPSRLIGAAITNSDGNFSFNGSPIEPNLPGLHVVAIVHQSSGFISDDAIIYSNIINVTDDSNLSHSIPLAINSPIAGAGSLTIIQGDLNLENDPNGLTDKFGSQLVWLSFTSSFNGSNNISGLISPSGSWSVTLELDITESIGLLPATLWYGGWVDDFTIPSNPTPQYHIRPSSLNLNLDVREAPNLTASIESLSSNNSIYVVGDDLWVNGSAISAGTNPVDMEGDLILSVRQNGTFDSWNQIFNTTVNGSFSVRQNLSASLANVPAGEIEFQLRFYPYSIDTTDDANLSSDDPYLLISQLDLTIETSPQLRGSIGAFSVSLTDHRGMNVDFVEGNFDLSFNGNWFNTTTNSTAKLISILPLDANLVAGDYPIQVSFNGSTFYAPSVSSDTIRIKGGIDWTFTLAQDWTHLGNTTFINGSIFDEVHGTPILGQNITIYTISMISPNGDVDIAQGVVDNNTSTFSQQILMPTNFASSVYNFVISFDFYSLGPAEGPFYSSEESFLDAATGNISQQPTPSIAAGIESELVLNVASDREAEEDAENIVITNGQFDFSILVTDIADNSFVPNEDVEFIFDWNGTNQSIGTARSNENGTANFSWTASGIAPGIYDIRVIAYDNISSALTTKGSTRHLGNFTMTNLTVQGNTDIRIDSIPSIITAGLDFNVVGQVIDADDNSRLLISPVKLEVFWLNNPNETLITGYTTTTNGSFSMVVPTDVLNNGTVRGDKTLVISVIEDSSPFYLESSLETPMFVFGVSEFDSLKPLNPIIVNRGNDVNISGQLVESSNRFLPLSGYDVDVQLGETWIANLQTNNTGMFDLTYNIPTSNPLGLITATFWFNGSSDLLGVNSNISTIIVRSQTFMVIDPITDNPVAGQSFNISGTILSDNGSGLEQSDGTVLPANILFSIDGQPTGFSVTGGAVQIGGVWNATITLTNSFAAGTHIVDAAYIPAVNFYLGSNDTEQFDSRGFSDLIFMDPIVDSLGQPTLNDRTERGNNISIELLLQDNTGSPVEGQQLIVTFVGTSITTTLTTLANGSAFGELLVPSDQIVGIMDISAEFAGIPGTTGMIGSQTNTSFVVLAQTNLTIIDYPEGLVAGDYMLINGTLLDDLALPLESMGTPSSAVVHLVVDGESVASIETDAINGTFTLGWAVPEDISAGVHTIEVEFYGGRDWVDPIGFGEPSNPEYYLPSSDTVDFNISVPTVLSLLTQSGDVNREELMVIEGLLVDIVNNPLDNLTLEVWLDGEFMTNVDTDSEGFFAAIYPVPADAELGPVSLEVRFTGTTFYLPSEANSTWNIFSHILVSVDIAETIAVGQNISITGSVVDNQLLAIPNHNVDLVIQGIVISTVITDSNGNFLHEWTVPDIFEFGNHTLFAYSESQGYYRANSSNASFFLAHRSDLTVIFDEGPDVTRGEIWVLSGRLFDFDSLTKEGLEGETIRVLLDGNEIGTTSTINDGEWELIVPATMDLTRGIHSFEIIFDGTNSHLGTNDYISGTVWANVAISIDQSSTAIAIRSDGTFGPIELTGSISEIGGTGEVFESITIFIGNGSDCVNEREGARCIASSLINTQWSNGNFTISTIAPSWYAFGSQYIHLDTLSNQSLYINEATVSHPIFVQLNVDFEWDIQQVIPDEREEIKGSMTITANDTGAGVPGIAVTFTLTNSSNGEQASLTITTDSNGVASFEFNSDPPFGDEDTWGELSLDVQINDPVISPASKEKFELLRTENSFDPNYKSIDETSGQSLWIYLVVLLISALIAGGVVIYRRRIEGELMKDAAEVFAYTAELLAAGDSIRETIFNCYQSLCSVLQQNGFLRRDFETVREFEVAIRQAMPEISDDALSAIDNMFEMARYSREELGPQHQAAAQQALERMSQEIGMLTNIPTR
ncbi:MAG: transglutaminase domain-containing protein, partial [Candidatus Poseidoniaceae archaeon]|nr:transglutaminase domain-containing protein [Candidatus Poseidoniaceae archaeon]